MPCMILRIHRQWVLLAVLIVGVAFFVYSRWLWNEFVIWDDDYLIVNNPLIRGLSFTNIKAAFTSYDPELYVPLTYISYQINYVIGGLTAFIYHLTNLLLHATNALLVGMIAYRLSDKNRWIATAVSLLFAVHPLHTEAVIWASARKDVLSATFFLMSLSLYLKHRESELRSTYIWSVVSFFLGLLSKVSVITLPLILLLLDWREKQPWNRKMLVEKLPYFGLSVIFGIVSLFGKQQQISHTSLLETSLIMIKSTVFYLEKMILPLDLSPMYPFTGSISLLSPEFFVPLIFLAILIAFAAWSLKRTREVMFALGFLLLSIGPSLINFRKGEEGDIYLASDRYAYIASFAVIFLVCMMLWKLRERFSTMMINVTVGVLILVFGSLGYAQGAIWQNSETLFKSVIASYPQAQAAHHNLGVLYQQQGHPQMALDKYQNALQIAPKASTESNVGDIFRESGMYAEAGTHYQRALVINPRSVDAMLGLGLLFLQQNDVKQAIIAMQSAVEFGPDDSRTHLNYGAALMAAKRIDDAIAEYQKATELDPLNAAAFFNLAVAFERSGDTDASQEALARALELDPSLAQQ